MATFSKDLNADPKAKYTSLTVCASARRYSLFTILNSSPLHWLFVVNKSTVRRLLGLNMGVTVLY